MKDMNSRRRTVVVAVEGNHHCQTEEHRRQERAPVKVDRGVATVGASRRPSLGAGGKPCKDEGAQGGLDP